MVIFQSKQKTFEGNLKINYVVEDQVLNIWVWKFIKILICKIMLMILSLNWIEPMLSISKWLPILH